MATTEGELPERVRCMPDPTIPWPPHVGDLVGIRGSQLIGLVRTIAGVGAIQRFVLSVRAPATNDPELYLRLTAAAEHAHTVYPLDELEPHQP